MLYKHLSSFELKNAWKKAEHKWVHSLHTACSRIGSFPPVLARYFILIYSQPNDVVLDPFSGKGTAPLEACLEGRKGIGNDLAPEAFVLTHAKVRAVGLDRVLNYLRDLKERTSQVHVNLDSVSDDVKLFYHRDTLDQLARVREILRNDSSDEAIFVKALILGILHGSSSMSLSLPCSHSFSMAPKYVRSYARRHNLIAKKRNVFTSLENKARRVLKDGLPQTRGEAYREDAISFLSSLVENSVDLIVTSPPYLNVQTYAWDNWLRLWFLGCDHKRIRKKLLETNRTSIYSNYMRVCLGKMYEVLKDDSACFVVVGDVKKGKKTVVLADLIAEQAEAVGFEVNRIIDDVIPKGRKYLMYIQEKKGISMDRIVELHKGTPKANEIEISWEARGRTTLDSYLD